ncbi:MAG: SufD family Fe-S cluster assembly protein [Bacilli bacterium]|nr:SufD family Fe-S cluster assembly protein [Bacilli bacterium]
MAKNNLTYIDNLPNSLHLEVKEGETLCFNVALFKEASDTEIVIDLAKDASLVAAMADFSKGKFRFKLTVNLNGDNSKAEWHLASLGAGNASKIFECSAFHKGLETEALMSNYGITRDEGKLVFTGVSDIPHGAKKTKTRQVAKVIVFDPKSDGQASPVLCIDDNDVEASHAAVVGRLNEQHLFYLESRGVSREEAKRLITLGYLKPIEQFFSDEGLIGKIDEAIEGGV